MGAAQGGMGQWKIPRQDIRRLLKTFGVRADEAIGPRAPGSQPLHIRIVLGYDPMQ
jgi:hypothetical protein